jgi:hypothetical protein
MSELDNFLKDLEGAPTDDLLEKPLEVEEAKVEPEKVETEDEVKLKNRRERRLYEKFESRGKEVNALTEEVVKLRNIVESQTVRQNSGDAEYLKKVERIFGDASPEAREATELLKGALQGVHDTARKEALDEALTRFEQDKRQEQEAVANEEKNLDEILDAVEEDHGIDMSDEAERKGFLGLLEKLSPKDKEGNIVEYADADATAELYKSRKVAPSTRAKELAGRSMVHSGASGESKLQSDANERFLIEHGII